MDVFSEVECSVYIVESCFVVCCFNCFVSNLFDQMCFESGVFKFCFDWCDFCDFVNVVVVSVGDLLVLYLLIIDILDDLLFICVDFVFIEQVFVNFFFNVV